MWSVLLERMPVLNEATFSERRSSSVPNAVSTSQGAPPKIPNGVAKPVSAPLVDLLDLSSDDIPISGSSGGDFIFLESMLFQLLYKKPIRPTKVVVLICCWTFCRLGILLLKIAYPNMILYLQVKINEVRGFIGHWSTPSSIQASSPVGSSMMDLLDGFGASPSMPVMYQHQMSAFIAIFSFLQLHLDPASGSTLPGDGSITQKLRVSNNQHGKKSLVIRVRINYKVNEKDVLEEGQINNFPRGL